jgi:hypothetical protein
MIEPLVSQRLSGKRMARIYERHQPGAVYMSVNLGRRDVSMAEQGLEHAQIGPALQQMRRKGMAQDMRADLFPVYAGSHRQFAQYLEQSYA